MKPLRIATRGSRLALWQAERTRDILLELQKNLAVEIVPIKSEGDAWQTQRIQDLGVVGIFTREIEKALLQGRADIAVHSLKDLPTEMPPDLALGALLPRDDPRDALVAHSLIGFDDDESRVVLSALPRSACIGTSSLRRQAQLLRQRPDLRVMEIRGNVPTRLAKVEDGEIDGIMLSAAGLDRLGLHPRGCLRLDPEIMLPAPAQGTIAVQVRADDKDTHALLRRADDLTTRLTTTTERLLLHALQGGCRVPLGALARLDGDTLHLQARLLTVDGKRVLHSSRTGPANDPRGLAAAVADHLFSQGAREILSTLRQDPL